LFTCHSANKRILSYFVEKRSIVLQLAVSYVRTMCTSTVRPLEANFLTALSSPTSESTGGDQPKNIHRCPSVFPPARSSSSSWIWHLKPIRSSRRERTVKGSVTTRHCWFLYSPWTFGNNAPNDGQAVALILSPLKSQLIHTTIKGRWYKYEILLTLDVLQDLINGLQVRWTFRAESHP